MAAARENVISVDFQTRRRLEEGYSVPAPPPVRLQIGTARDAFARSPVFVFFWRPPLRGGGGEYLGGRWESWGWTMFVWTSDAAVGFAWTDLVEHRGYVAERMTRSEFALFLRRAPEVGGLLVDGELDDGGAVINADPEQLIDRADALALLRY